MSEEGLETRGRGKANKDTPVIGATDHEYSSVKSFVGEKKRGG
jgi:hypothetical protein